MFGNFLISLTNHICFLQDEGGMIRRPPVLLVKNDHDNNEKPPTIILRTREGENRAVSPSQTRTPIVLKYVFLLSVNTL